VNLSVGKQTSADQYSILPSVKLQWMSVAVTRLFDGPPRRRLDVVLSRFYLFTIAVLVLAATNVGAQQASPVFRLDLTQQLKPLQKVRVAFLNDQFLLLSLSQMEQIDVAKHAVLVKDAEQSAGTIVVDVKQQKLVDTVTLGNQDAHLLWPTHDGNLIVQAGNELWLYNRDLQKTGRFPLSPDCAPAKIQVSPDGTAIIAQTMPYHRRREDHPTTHLLRTDTLGPLAFANAPRFFSLVGTGFIAVDEKAEKFYYRPFSNSTDQLLVKGSGKCLPHAQAVADDRILVASCSAKKGQVVNLEGQPTHSIEDDSWDFVQTSVSGRAFVLGFQRYSKGHFLQDFNPLVLMGGPDDPANVIVLKAYERDSQKPLLELKWKPTKSEPLYDSYDNWAVALSPSGRLMAIVHGTWLETYQLPIGK
jgi:hypothetical protein